MSREAEKLTVWEVVDGSGEVLHTTCDGLMDAEAFAEGCNKVMASDGEAVEIRERTAVLQPLV